MSEQFAKAQSNELLRLTERLEDHGRLQYATLPSFGEYTGPVLVVFHKHVVDGVIAAPGTDLGPRNDDNSDTWRIVPSPKPNEKSSALDLVSLTDIVTALPGEIAEWAVNTQKSVINQFRNSSSPDPALSNGAGALLERLQNDLEMAQASMRLLPAMKPNEVVAQANKTSGHQVRVVDRHDRLRIGISRGTNYLPPYVSIEEPAPGDATRITHMVKASIHSLALDNPESA